MEMKLGSRARQQPYGTLHSGRIAGCDRAQVHTINSIEELGIETNEKDVVLWQPGFGRGCAHNEGCAAEPKL